MLARMLALAAIVSMRAVPVHSEPLQPTGKWVVEFAANDCLVSRQYGASGETLILVFRKLPLDSAFGLVVLKSNGRTGFNSGSGRLRFGQSAAVEAKFGAYQLTPGVRKIEFGTEDNDAYRAAPSSSSISVEIPHEVTAEFAVPNLRAALSLLDQCALDLGQTWGVSKDEQRNITRPAEVLNSDEVFRSSDYPIDALKNDVSGFAIARYAVDESGRPSDCVVVKSSQNRDLDRATCVKLMKRAKLRPALDRSGKPVRSFKFLKISWLLYG